jgi:hypothetical protein
MGLPLYRVTRGYENLFGWQAVPELAEGKRFFLKQRSKKLLHPRCPSPRHGHTAAYPHKQKFFGSFFQKRTACF